MKMVVVNKQLCGQARNSYKMRQKFAKDLM